MGTSLFRRQKADGRKQKCFGVVLLSVLLGVTTCARKPPSKYNVLLITLDTFRADRVGANTPNLEKLGRESVSFRNAESPAPLTLPAHATILSGRLPLHHGVRINGAGSFSGETLATSFSRGGWRTGAFIGAFVLDHRFGLNRGFDVYDDAILRDPNDDSTSNLEAQRRGSEVVDAALTWLGAKDARPFFAWVHLYDAHVPYAPPPPYPQTYDGEIAYVDAQIGRLLASVDRRNTIVAIVGDHGESLGEHGELTHGLLLYEGTLHVPMMIAAPETKAIALAEPVSTSDLAPTIASLAGGPALVNTDGRDLAANLRESSEPKRAAVYSESEYPRAFGWAGLSAMRGGTIKLISGGAPELYDLAADPHETVNVLAKERRTYRELEAAVATFQKTAVATSTAVVDAETRAKLAALGYIAPSAGSSSSGPPRDPRSMMPLFVRFENAIVMLDQHRPKDALSPLQQVVAADPANRLFRKTLGRAYRELGDLPKAIALYRESVALGPEDPDAWYDLGSTLQEAGNETEARVAIGEALKREPNRPEAHNGLGVSYAASGDLRRAEEEFRRALEVDPRNARAWNNLGNVLRDSGRLDEAGQSFRRAAEFAPNYPDPLNGAGVLLVQQGRPRDAVDWFDRALKLAPDFYEAQLNRGIALQMSGDANAASEQFQALLRTLPGDRRYER
ncbi:MAG: tetratricopeptide repeat protein, partial [Thermoanaerobaculia bacterium]